MRRNLFLTGLVAIGLVWFVSRSFVSPSFPRSRNLEVPAIPVLPIEPRQVPRQVPPLQPLGLGKTAIKPAPIPIKTRATPLSPGETVRHAFRIVVNKGQYALEAVEELHGNFHAARKPRWAPGMICCRLLNLQNEVIAEETMFAPDHNCVVLDPHVQDLNGDAIPSPLTPEGPISFQARFPKIQGAVLLNIYRISSSTPPAGNAEPKGQLMGSIPLSL